MDHRDVCRWQRYSRIVGSDFGIVPLLDLAEKNVRQGFGRKTQGLADALKVVGNDHSAEYGRNVQYLAWSRLEIFILHRRIGGAEVDCLLFQLLDSAAGSD